MPNQRQLFLNHVGQTSPSPLMLEIEKARGIYLYEASGKRYVDLVSGVSVSNLGHNHPSVVAAVKEQVDKYMHLMVYGEIVQSPQVKLAELLAKLLPAPLDCTYFVNSGSEANEGAMKLAKRHTGRFKIIAFKNAYHGSTQGSLSVMGGEYFKQAFRPLLPGISFLDFNKTEQIDEIDESIAAVIIEPIQGEGGIIVPSKEFMQTLRKRCTETGSLLIFDEVQTGFGRTGKLFAMQHFDVVPDIVSFAKGLGGGMPIGAFVSSKEIMDSFMTNPVLGHITTFGGHPVSCAAGLASLNILVSEPEIIASVDAKAERFRKNLVHPKIKLIRGIGLLMAVELESNKMAWDFIYKGAEMGIITDPFLFCESCIRIAPPLTITNEEIDEVCILILNVLHELQ
jgi:acetylornithine/succinyldiaminopimelate/putrescine aminotransferase